MASKPLLIFGLKVAAWLPLMFYAWYGLSEWIAALVIYLSSHIVGFLDPDIVMAFLRKGMQMEAAIRLPSGAPRDYANIVIGVMEFGYGLPLYAALTLVPPTPGWVLLLRLVVGALLVLAVQVWTTVFGVLQMLHVQMAEQVPQFQTQHPLIDFTIIAAFKLGVFILPFLAPLLLWGGLHRDFLAQLVGRDALGTT